MPHSRLHGFTWPELLAVLAVSGILAGLALPALGDAIARHRLRATSDALLEALNQARATAVRRNHRTSLCASVDGHTCSPTVDWTGGWIGFDWDQETVFEAMGPLDDRLATAHRQGRYRVDFDESGTSAGSNQTITVCVRGRPASAVSVTIGNGGRAHRAMAAAGDAATCAATPSQKR